MDCANKVYLQLKLKGKKKKKKKERKLCFSRGYW